MKDNWFGNKVKVAAIVFGLVFLLSPYAHAQDITLTIGDLTSLLTETLADEDSGQITEFVETLTDEERNSLYQFIQNTDLTGITTLSQLLDLFNSFGDANSAIKKTIEQALANAIQALEEFVYRVNSPSF